MIWIFRSIHLAHCDLRQNKSRNYQNRYHKNLENSGDLEIRSLLPCQSISSRDASCGISSASFLPLSNYQYPNNDSLAPHGMYNALSSSRWQRRLFSPFYRNSALSFLYSFPSYTSRGGQIQDLAKCNTYYGRSRNLHTVGVRMTDDAVTRGAGTIAKAVMEEHQQWLLVPT
jgi:hypothetical protein